MAKLTGHVVTAPFSKEADFYGSFAAWLGHRLGGLWARRPEMQLTAGDEQKGSKRRRLLSVRASSISFFTSSLFVLCSPLNDSVRFQRPLPFRLDGAGGEGDGPGGRLASWGGGRGVELSHRTPATALAHGQDRQTGQRRAVICLAGSGGLEARHTPSTSHQTATRQEESPARWSLPASLHFSLGTALK